MILIKGSNKLQYYVVMGLIKRSNKLQYDVMGLIKGSNKLQYDVVMGLIKGSNKLQYDVVMGLIKLFYNLIHVELTVRNRNSISADIIEDILENVLNVSCFCSFQPNLAVVLDFLTSQDKHKIHRLSVIIICYMHAAKRTRKYLYLHIYLPKEKSIELSQ